jgi:hypothetical protein
MTVKCDAGFSILGLGGILPAAGLQPTPEIEPQDSQPKYEEVSKDPRAKCAKLIAREDQEVQKVPAAVLNGEDVKAEDAQEDEGITLEINGVKNEIPPDTPQIYLGNARLLSKGGSSRQIAQSVLINAPDGWRLMPQLSLNKTMELITGDGRKYVIEPIDFRQMLTIIMSSYRLEPGTNVIRIGVDEFKVILPAEKDPEAAQRRRRYENVWIERVISGKDPISDPADYISYLREEQPDNFEKLCDMLQTEVEGQIKTILEWLDKYFVKGRIELWRNPIEIYDSIIRRWKNIVRLMGLVRAGDIPMDVDMMKFLSFEHPLAGLAFAEDGTTEVETPPMYEMIAGNPHLDFGKLEVILRHISENHGRLEQGDETVPEAYELYNGQASALGVGMRERPTRIELPEPMDEIFWYDLHGFRAYEVPYSKKGDIDGRLYITIDPKRYGEHIGDMVGALERTMLRLGGSFFFKALPEVNGQGHATRRDQIVVYFNSKNQKEIFDEVNRAMDEVEDIHGRIFSDRGPYFTAKIRDGLFFGEQPTSKMVSFGGLRAGILEYAGNEIARLKRFGYNVPLRLQLAIIARGMFAFNIDPENPAFNYGGTNRFSYIYENIAADQGSHIGG